jgi:hypothetical protein
MSLLELRILPPLAIARLGASEHPLENYDLVPDETKVVRIRKIVPAESLRLDIGTGEIVDAYMPTDPVTFRDGDKIRPVAPFLEVFARTAPDTLEPLTIHLLDQHHLKPADLRWTVRLGNRKIARRTLDANDRIEAELKISDHVRYPVLATSPYFRDKMSLPLGWVQYVKPTDRFPEIRFRFTPAAGLVYGSSEKRIESFGKAPSTDPILAGHPERIIYDPTKGTWQNFTDNNTDVPLRTEPAAIYAGYSDPSDAQISWGYLDDECDGIVSVELTVEGKTLTAFARIGAGPPTFAPDAIPIRTVHDDLQQALLGPDIDGPVTLAEAEEIVRRAIETVRLLNTAAMNGNTIQGRTNAASTMVRQDSNDFSRFYQPIMAPRIVDNHAILALHETILTALRGGTGAWFAHTLRRPEEVGDLTDSGRRKMPAMMRGADGRHLVLTRRQINTIVQASIGSLFEDSSGKPSS